MLHSMTAFAQQEQSDHLGTLSWEVRAVNHRYLEPGFKLPDAFRAIEPHLRDILSGSAQRGKIDAQLRYSAGSEADQATSIDQVRLQQLLTALDLVQQQSTSSPTPSTLELLSWPGVQQTNKVDQQAQHSAAIQLFEKTIQDLVAMRAREGEELGRFVLRRLDGVDAVLQQLRSNMPELLAAQQQKLLDRVAQLEASVEPARLEQELLIIAQKTDISEECDRLETHIAETRRALTKGGVCGRRLDFLMQEFNREANTLSSKAIASSISQAAIELKVLIEQMREQIQNIE
ncbi:MAG: YicC/YloC family endoribonuclease [Pseudomonadales bacterium]